MKSKTNLAYTKTNLQRIQKNRLAKSDHIGRIYDNKSKIRTKFYISSILMATAFSSFLIFNLVKSNEITLQIDQTRKMIKAQDDEKIRLKAQLNQTMNSQKVEEYAKQRGMKKLNNNQITYIYSSQGNSIELKNKNQKAAENSNNLLKFLSESFHKIKKYFS